MQDTVRALLECYNPLQCNAGRIVGFDTASGFTLAWPCQHVGVSAEHCFNAVSKISIADLNEFIALSLGV